jgi:copper resistance protein C
MLTEVGTYTVAYAVTAVDGHPVDGSLTFSYAPPSPPAPSSEAVPPITTPATTAPSPAAPSGAVANSPAPFSTGVPGWVPAAVAGPVVVLGAVLFFLRRRHARR